MRPHRKDSDIKCLGNTEVALIYGHFHFVQEVQPQIIWCWPVGSIPRGIGSVALSLIFTCNGPRTGHSSHNETRDHGHLVTLYQLHTIQLRNSVVLQQLVNLAPLTFIRYLSWGLQTRYGMSFVSSGDADILLPSSTAGILRNLCVELFETLNTLKHQEISSHMTALDTSSESEDTKPTPGQAPNRAVPSTSQGVSGGPRDRIKARKRAMGSPWCCAMLWTVLIVVFAYVALYWTDPEQVAMRQRAWEATVRKFRMEKEVVHASR